MKHLFATCCAFFWLGYNSTLLAQNAQEIIEKHIEAIGGREAWAKIKTLRSEASMKSNGTEIKMRFTQEDKKAMRQDIHIMGMDGYSILTQTEDRKSTRLNSSH